MDVNDVMDLILKSILHLPRKRSAIYSMIEEKTESSEALSFINGLISKGEKLGYFTVKYRNFNRSESKDDIVEITESGLRVYRFHGTYKEFLFDEYDQKVRSDEKLKHELWLARMSRKWFWIAAILGLVGGICGIISLIYQISG